MLGFAPAIAAAQDPIVVGLLRPSTGSYKDMGFSEGLGAQMAVDEINASGGILGRPVRLLMEDSRSDPEHSRQMVQKMVNQEGVSLIFGGVSSAVAIAASAEAAKFKVPYIAVMSYANETTGTRGHKYVFRESHNAWMTSKALAEHLKDKLEGKRMFYITADYSWGHSSESTMREFSQTDDVKLHQGKLVTFPNPSKKELNDALDEFLASEAEVLVATLTGKDLTKAMAIAQMKDIHKTKMIVVPGLTLDTVRVTGYAALENAYSAIPWCWQVPFEFGFEKGKSFVENFTARYQRKPSSPAASAYSTVYQFKGAAERGGSLLADSIIDQLEGHSYVSLKDMQTWRGLDHQNVQSVYVVKVRDRATIMKNRKEEDYFEILNAVDGEQLVRTEREWKTERLASNLPEHLDELPSPN
jgi:branched-chain amino acid transport system substrate-binding protein